MSGRLIVAAALTLAGGADVLASMRNETVTAVEAGHPGQDASTQVAASIRTRLSAPSLPGLGTLNVDERRALEMLYAPDETALWTGIDGTLLANVEAALDLFDDAPAQGLDSRDYASAQLRQRARGLVASRGHAAPDDIAGFDVAMSAAALRYFTHLHLGRINPTTIGLRLHVPADRHDMVVLLRSAIAAQRIPDAATELVPPLAPYRQLVVMLSRYRTLAADPALPPAPSFKDPLRPGDVAAPTALRALSRRLVALGDLRADRVLPDQATYDEPLVDAVERFQSRHGLEPDGVIGRATHAALSVPLSWRVRQIELALERLRWLPDLTNERIIGLNIPMFRLWAWDAVRPEGLPAFSTRAIVGRALRTETPVFVEELREVIFRPYWNVPTSILRSEILPVAEKDLAYLDRQGMEIVRGPGDDARVVPASTDTLAQLKQGALRLRQRPGPRNALGLVKFVFPNSDNVYLHSTPSQDLFSKTRRDFSHGCVRVENPAALAEWVLKDQTGWTLDRIDEAMSGNESRRVKVERPVQVVLFYVTAAVVPEDGTLHFAEDIYGHDPVLDRALRAVSDHAAVHTR